MKAGVGWSPTRILVERLLGRNPSAPSLLLFAESLAPFSSMIPVFPRIVVMASQQDLAVVRYALRDISSKHGNIEFLTTEECSMGRPAGVQLVIVPDAPKPSEIGALTHIVCSSLRSGPVMVIGKPKQTSALIPADRSPDVTTLDVEHDLVLISVVSPHDSGSDSAKPEFTEGDLDDLWDIRV